MDISEMLNIFKMFRFLIFQKLVLYLHWLVFVVQLESLSSTKTALLGSTYHDVRLRPRVFLFDDWEKGVRAGTCPNEYVIAIFSNSTYF